MAFREITLRGFKNYIEVTLRLDQQTTLLCGDNGSGKTNLIEALYLLQTLKPLRTGELVRWGEQEGSLLAIKDIEERETRQSIILSNNFERRLKIDDKLVKSVDEFLKGSSVIAFLPQHLWIIRGEPGERREYLDRAVFNLDFNYLYSIRKFKKVLSHRNAMLKMSRTPVDKDVWNEQLLFSAIPVIKQRINFVKKIAPIVAEIYSFLSSTKGEFTVLYDMSRDGMVEGDDIESKGALRLSEKAQEESFRGCSLWGPHRHDLKILLNGRLLGTTGSQGEQRLGILALKLAEVELLRLQGIRTLVLLDDLASELDPIRRLSVMSYLQNSSAQVVLTACDPRQWSLNGAKTVTTYDVNSGQIKELF